MNHSFGLVGGGWRAEFFLRIARDLPEQFPCVGLVVRNTEKRAAMGSAWPVPVFASIEELVEQARPSFVVTSVGWDANLPLLEWLSERGIAVLSETPIAPELPDLRRAFELWRGGARIQLAEQYLFQPLHAARLSLVNSGKLGVVREADVSSAHGYHGVSLLRNYLQVGLELPTITARKFRSKIARSRTRTGPPSEPAIDDTERIIAQFDYGDKLGVFDFTGDQYFSWIRSPRVMVRGDQGEINNTTVRLLHDFKTPLQYELTRQDTGETGNLEGLFHRAITGGSEILYQNPFPGARWMDDEIAIATCLLKMQHYLDTGESFYGMPEACHDRYLDILINKAVESGAAVTAESQPWKT